MAGHSKWKNIKHKKAAADAQKAKKFTKLLKDITVCARVGGGDLQSNPHLRTLLEKANEINMPKDNYLRAIKRGTGEIEGGAIEEHIYEGYGPGGIAVLVVVLTDNKNRAAGEVRSMFQRNNGALGEAGSVSWMFERKGLISGVSEKLKEDDLLELLLEFSIDTMTIHENEFSIVSDIRDIQNIEKTLKANGCTIEDAEAGYYAKNTLEISNEKEELAAELLHALEALDDVQNVYTNLA